MDDTREPNSCQSENKLIADKINIKIGPSFDLSGPSKSSIVTLGWKDKCSDTEKSSEKDISRHEVSKAEMNEILDAESGYSRDSFYSDISSDSESEITDVTPRSLLSASSYCPFNARESVDGNIRKTFPNDENEIYKLTDDMRYLSMDSLKEINSNQQRFSSKRRNMTFTNEELMKIERDNQILLRRIMKFQRPQNKAKIESVKTRLSSSAINRRKLQKKIEKDNMVSSPLENVGSFSSRRSKELLLRKIQQAKPYILPRAKSASCRLSFH